MKGIRHIVLGIAAVTSLGMASALHAQGVPVPGQVPPPGMGHGPQGMPGARGPGANFDPAAMADARLAKAKATLNITSAQEPAWAAFAGFIKQQADAMKKVRAAAVNDTNAKVPVRMAQHVAMAELHVENAKAMQAKVTDLYNNVLTPEQQAIADKMLGGMHRRMGRPAN
jgi:hypothetical protein